MDNEWVERRLAMLEPSERLAPDSARAYAQLLSREGRRLVARRFWMGGMAAAASILIVGMLAMPSRGICCARPDVEDYKQSGAPSAPVAIEIYADFECPACGDFYRETWPQVVSQYVSTGKVRVVHRDFPLLQHRFANLAARYANGAGELGVYEAVFQRLFATQAQWSGNGDIDAALAPALSPALMARLRERVANDAKSAASIASDVRMGAGTDRVDQTPTLIVVTKDGQRHKLAGAPSFPILRSYLDELIGR